MGRKTSTEQRRRELDVALKAAFDAVAQEPAPEPLVDLAHELDNPEPSSKAS